MSRKGKHYVLGYFVMKGGIPCTLVTSMHAIGLLVPSEDGQALTPFTRGSKTLWSAKTRAARAIYRTKRETLKMAGAKHIEFPHMAMLAGSGEFTIHPLRNMQGTLAAQLTPKPTTKSGRRKSIITDL